MDETVHAIQSGGVVLTFQHFAFRRASKCASSASSTFLQQCSTKNLMLMYGLQAQPPRGKVEPVAHYPAAVCSAACTYYSK